MAFVHTALHGQFTFGAVDLMCPAWRCLNLQVLQSSPSRIGSDVVIPGVAGSRPYRRRPVATVRTLELLICGDVDPDGVAYANQVEGLISNINLLRAEVDDFPTTTEGTVSATLTLATGATVTRDIHPGPLEVGESFGFGKVRAALDINILLGSF